MDFPEDAQWLNTEQRLTLNGNLRGHIVVLDFWTYCCINCIHVIPDLKILEEKYASQPVIFIGVHSPKFENEQDTRNVESAVQRYGITHPVLIDKDHETWNMFSVNAWPTLIILDETGKIIYNQSGEGQRVMLDDAIAKALLRARNQGTLAREKLTITAPAIARSSALSFPGKIHYDEKTRQLCIADSGNNRILITQLDGLKARVISTIGDTQPGLRNGIFSLAQLRNPQGIARNGNYLYIADTDNHCIRMADLVSKNIFTIAGTGAQSRGHPSVGHAPDIALNSPWDVLLTDNTLLIAMAGSHQIYALELKNNIITVFAGTGEENIMDGRKEDALFAQPSGLASSEKSIYVADSEVSAIRRIALATGTVSTVVGKGLFHFGNKDGSCSSALLQHPLGADYRDGTLYVADTYNHAIRAIDIKAKEVRTIIGKKDEKNICVPAMHGMSTCAALSLFEPNDVAALGERLLIADTNNHLIRSFNLTTMELEDIEIIFP